MKSYLRDYAIYYAGQKHANQKYGEGSYFDHLEAVDYTLAEAGYNHFDPERIACWLHDILEDCFVGQKLGLQEIEYKFGIDIANIVFCVTNEYGSNRIARFVATSPKYLSNKHALAIKLADRICNMRMSIGNEKFQKMYKKEISIFRDTLYGHFLEYENIHKLWSTFDYLSTFL